MITHKFYMGYGNILALLLMITWFLFGCNVHEGIK